MGNKEFDSPSNTTQDVKEWILKNPEAIAFSSHTMMGPMPIIEGIDVISIVMLRNPISRIISAYNFEKKQNAPTWGSKLAKNSSLENYVLARLQRNNDYFCRNFQCERLSSLVVSDESKLDRAILALSEFSVIGVVEEFEASIQVLHSKLAKHFPDFKAEYTHSNQSKKSNEDLNPILRQLLIECNKSDYLLWQKCKEMLKDARPLEENCAEREEN